MKKTITFTLLVAILAIIYTQFFAIDSRLTGKWKLEVYDFSTGTNTTLLMTFTDEEAESCSVVGNWKKVQVLSITPRQNEFFPDPSLGILHQELSYQLEADTLTIGLNNVCDYGKSLTGKLSNYQSTGIYSEWGWGQSKQLGTFSIARNDT